MILLKFMAWMVSPTKRPDPNDNPASRDLVLSCEKYTIEHFPESQEAIVRTFKAGSDVPVDTVLLGSPENFVTMPKFRKLYVMNEQGKTIDSYCPEERRG